MSVVLPLPGAELPVPTPTAAMGCVSHGDPASFPCTSVGQDWGGKHPWFCGYS